MLKKIFIDTQKHQQTEFEAVINNVPTFITASGTGKSIQNAKVRTRIGTLCTATFSCLVYEDALTPTTTKKTDKFGTLITYAKT
jgi:hypothetical protein